MWNDQQLQRYIDEIAEHGYAIFDDFLDDGTVKELAGLANSRYLNAQMQSARIGKAQVMLNQEIRGDSIDWLDENDSESAIQAYFQAMQALKAAVNAKLWMNLHSLEAHLAVYPPGAFYKKHLDQFAQSGEQPQQKRQLSGVLYLNTDWQTEDGGALRLYLDESKPLDILPVAGRMVLFLSARFWHEVLPAQRQRISLTGWFRDRASSLL